MIIEVVDPKIRSIVAARVSSPEVASRIAAALNIDLSSELAEHGEINLTDDEITVVEGMLGIRIDSTSLVILRAATVLDDLPYEVHTGRELRLMLEGRKPLAVFTDAVTISDPWIFPEDAFDPYVRAGTLVKRDHCWAAAVRRGASGEAIRSLMYAVAEESWRIDAYVDLWTRALHEGWNAQFERREGELLGYEPWQVDYWMQRWKPLPPLERRA